MQKVLVIGCSGAGKSTFARRLQSLTGLPLYYLDRLWHRPDRTNVTREAFDAALAGLLTRPAWIIDGNYSRTLPGRLEACDTVFLLDYPLDVCLAGVEDRRGCLRPDMPWVEEELDAEFLQYILDFGQTQIPAIRAMLEAYRGRRQIFTFHSRGRGGRLAQRAGRDPPALPSRRLPPRWRPSFTRRSTPSTRPITPRRSWTPGPPPAARTSLPGTRASGRT